MTLFRSWCWAYEYDDFTVACTPDGVHWSADMAYYAGKPSQPSARQSFAEFMEDGAPPDYDSIPDQIFQELRGAVEQAQRWQAQMPDH